MTDAKRRICLGAFAGAHGVKGHAKIKTFTEAPDGVAAYGPVESEDGARRFTLKIEKIMGPDIALASAPEIKSREDAETLKGVRLYVDRGALPEPDEDDFYLDDLVGLAAFDETGAPAGAVAAVYNFGAGDMIELKDIPGVKGVRLVPFTKEAVPGIDVADGRLTVVREAIEQPDEPA
ncbi:MAG: ribosome maturation factor RimM [Parvularculaceae bacterium]